LALTPQQRRAIVEAAQRACREGRPLLHSTSRPSRQSKLMPQRTIATLKPLHNGHRTGTDEAARFGDYAGRDDKLLN
jgi:hypothetical protein